MAMSGLCANESSILWPRLLTESNFHCKLIFIMPSFQSHLCQEHNVFPKCWLCPAKLPSLLWQVWRGGLIVQYDETRQHDVILKGDSRPGRACTSSSRCSWLLQLSLLCCQLCAGCAGSTCWWAEEGANHRCKWLQVGSVLLYFFSRDVCLTAQRERE